MYKTEINPGPISCPLKVPVNKYSAVHFYFISFLKNKNNKTESSKVAKGKLILLLWINNKATKFDLNRAYEMSGYTN